MERYNLKIMGGRLSFQPMIYHSSHVKPGA